MKLKNLGKLGKLPNLQKFPKLSFRGTGIKNHTRATVGVAVRGEAVVHR